MGLKHHLIPLQNKHEWEAALLAVPHVYTHTHWYNEAMQLASKREIFLYMGETPDFKVICPIALRQKGADDPYDINTPYGFSGFASKGSYVSFAEEWHTFMRANDFVCGYIMLHPFLQANGLAKSSELFAGKNTYYLNLTPPQDQLLQNFSHGHQYDLKQWLNKRVQITLSKNKELTTSFVNLYEQLLRRKGAASVYNFGATSWERIFAEEASVLICVQHNGQIEAAAVFILYGDMADYFMVATTENGRVHAKGIIWEAIKMCKAKQIAWLHLGGGIKENDSLEQFKARFGAKAYRTYSFRQLYNTESYRALCEKYQVDYINETAYFPHYWAKRNEVL